MLTMAFCLVWKMSNLVGTMYIEVQTVYYRFWVHSPEVQFAVVLLKSPHNFLAHKSMIIFCIVHCWCQRTASHGCKTAQRQNFVDPWPGTDRGQQSMCHLPRTREPLPILLWWNDRQQSGWWLVLLYWYSELVSLEYVIIFSICKITWQLLM